MHNFTSNFDDVFKLAGVNAGGEITPLHLLQAILDHGEGTAFSFLESRKKKICEKIKIKPLTKAEKAVKEIPVPWSPGTKTVFVQTGYESFLLGHNYNGTEHLLLALLSKGGEAKDILEECGIKYDQVNLGMKQSKRANY